jgi:hypothetical protein
MRGVRRYRKSLADNLISPRFKLPTEEIADMARFDRVALVAVLWFATWTLLGTFVGRHYGFYLTGIVTGFTFSLLSTFLWPWILPNAIWSWMND